MANTDGLVERRRYFWSLLDFAEGSGLEIGPLHAAIVLRDKADVKYLDVFSRDQLLLDYRDDPAVDLDAIPEIDFHLSTSEGVRPLSKAAEPGSPYSWALASHVIEHVPDVIGWLGEIADVVEEGGALVLAVPDRRYCFDVFRPATTVGQMLEAHEAGSTVPSVRAVYDSLRSKVPVDTAALWAGEAPPGYDERELGLDAVMSAVERARAGEYVNCHVWTFTPDAFLEQVRELRDLGLSPWVVERIEAPHGSLEFFVVMRRWAGDAVKRAEVEEPRPRSNMPDWLFDQHRRDRRIADCERERAALRSRLDEKERELSHVRRDALALSEKLGLLPHQSTEP